MNMKMKRSLFALLAATVASAASPVVDNQNLLESKVDSINAKRGLELGGSIRGVAQATYFDSDQDGTVKRMMPDVEKDEFVTADLDFHFRPYENVRANATMRLEAGMQEYFAAIREKMYTIAQGAVIDENGNQVNTIYVSTEDQPGDTEYKEDVGETDGNAFYVTPYVKADIAGIEADLKATYLKTDKDFWSEMASAPNYRGGSIILNSNALYSNEIYSSAIGAFGMSSLENLYLSVYNSNPLNATNLLTSQPLVNALSNTDESQYLYSKLYNNYKNAHFYRNGYDAGTILSVTSVRNTRL